MAHTYLLQLYRVLADRRNAFTSSSTDEENADNMAFRLGQASTDQEVLAFLHENYHNKLPRRLQQDALAMLRKT